MQQFIDAKFCAQIIHKKKNTRKHLGNYAKKIGDDCNSKFVGAVRFELTTLCSQSRYANRTALCPECGGFVKKDAEKEGFEPPEVLPSTVFKTAAIDHSAISPLF